MKKTILNLVLLFIALPSLLWADNLRFATKPTLSPNGEIIYFSYDGDIFKVPAQGGNAVRIISMGGNEINPIPSPDGKLIAFASNLQGNNDVYVVAVNGGEIKRLTYHEGNDIPMAWSPDSKLIYFESNRANIKNTFSVPVQGGTPVKLFPAYFNTVTNLTQDPVTKCFYFNESGESVSFPTRKRYVGDHNPDILMWNPQTKEYKQITTYNGKDTWPMTDKEGNLYYVSDEANKESNIVKYNANGKPQVLTNFKESVQYPSISFNGNAIVFLLEYEINYLDTKTNKVTKPQIIIADNNVEVKKSFADQKASAVAVSADGKKFALAIRGGLYITDAEGKFFKKLDTPANERVDEIVWPSDNNTIYYTRTNKGYVNLYKISADGAWGEKQVYSTNANIISMVTSNKGDKIAFIVSSKDVFTVDLKNDAVSKIAQAEFWSFHGYNMNFSSDDSYLAFDGVNKFERDVFIYSFVEKKLYNLTNSASAESNPCFSPDGKNLYFVGNIYGTGFPRGGGSYKMYKLPLQRFNDKNFKSDVYDNLFATAKKDSTINLKIDFNDIYRRLKLVDDGAGNGLFTYSAKSNAWLMYSAKNQIFALNISDADAKPKQIKELQGRGYYIQSKKDLYFVSSGTVYRVDFNQSKGVKLFSASITVSANLNDEFEQMFNEAWATMDQGFYDVKFHGVDWNKMKVKYGGYLKYARNRSHLRTVMNDMLNELNTSHIGFTTNGNEENSGATKSYSAETGIIWKNDNPYVVDRILTDSPANNVEVGVLPGDVLVAVNDKKVDNSNNRESYFVSPVKPEEVKLRFRRAGKEFDVKIHTISYGELKNMLYTEWEDINRARVNEATNGRVAYMHMRDMTDASLAPFMREIHTDVANKDAIILDLRYNNGGNIHKEVIDMLRQKAHYEWSYRDFPKTTHPNVTPANKPIVVLINERSLSDAEVTSNGIKELGIAKLIGTETYRWIIFTSSVRMLDGSSCRMPAWGCYSLDGKDLEFSGVAPDIYIRNTFEDRYLGRDPQLMKAIEEINKDIK